MEESSLDRPWVRRRPARAVREAVICGGFAPLISVYAHRRVAGTEHLDRLDGPAIFLANHSSHADTPILLRALPRRWRRRTAVAAAADYFYRKKLLANAVSLAFCTVPLERRDAGADATDPFAQLIEDGWSMVLYPEGTRSRDGRVGRLKTGPAVLAAAHGLPIVPVHIGGTHTAMPTGQRWMHRPKLHVRHQLVVTFGPPIRVGADSDRFDVMDTVRRFMASCGAETTPDPRLARRAAKAAANAP